VDEKEIAALAAAVPKVEQFAAAVVKLKRGLDRKGGALLTPADVEGLVWGLQTLRGPQDADPAAPA